MHNNAQRLEKNERWSTADGELFLPQKGGADEAAQLFYLSGLQNRRNVGWLLVNNRSWLASRALARLENKVRFALQQILHSPTQQLFTHKIMNQNMVIWIYPDFIWTRPPSESSPLCLHSQLTSHCTHAAQPFTHPCDRMLCGTQSPLRWKRSGGNQYCPLKPFQICGVPPGAGGRARHSAASALARHSAGKESKAK